MEDGGLASHGSHCAASVGNRAPPHGARLARRCPGRASEQTCLSSASEEGSGLQASASASGASNVQRSERRRFLVLIARSRSLRIAPGSRLLCRRSPTESVSARSSAARRRAIRCERRRRRILDVRAADLQEEMAKQRFSVPPDPTKTAAIQRTSPRAAASNQTQRDARAGHKKGPRGDLCRNKQPVV